MSETYGRMFAFGLLLLASWAGWGAAIERLVLRRSIADRALHAGWGLAWTTVVGGVLNLSGGVGPVANGLLVCAGLLLLGMDGWLTRGRVRARWRRRVRWMRRRPALTAVILLLSMVLGVVYAVNVCSQYFNPHDDMHSYLVFPTRMIQTGTMDPEPFSERRLLVLGGQSFLQALVLGVADWRYLSLIDPGVSTLLAAALIVGLARDTRARPWSAALAVLLLVLVPPPRVNVTSLVSGLVLFLTLFRTLSRVALRRRPSVAGAVLVGLVVAGACSLKSTFIPVCILTVAGAYGLAAWRSGRRGGGLSALLVAGFSTVLLLAPWMISLYESSGTLLFPFLGRGFYVSAYGIDAPVGQGLDLEAAADRLVNAATDLRVIPVWILAVGFLLQRHRKRARAAVEAFLAAALVSHLALAILYPQGAYRYSWAFLFAAFLVLVLHSDLRSLAVAGEARLTARAALPVVLAVGVLLIAQSKQAAGYWLRLPRALQTTAQLSLSPGFKARWARRYSRMQEAVPPEAVMLTRLQYPFLLDFRRQTTYVADLPGGASPPPGMPLFEGSEALAAYLCATGVTHVAYSYRSEAGFSREVFRSRLDPQVHPWRRAQARFIFDFQENVEELGRTRHRVYDDGDVFVIDLGRTPEGVRLGCRPPGPLTSRVRAEHVP